MFDCIRLGSLGNSFAEHGLEVAPLLGVDPTVPVQSDGPEVHVLPQRLLERHAPDVGQVVAPEVDDLQVLVPRDGGGDDGRVVVPEVAGSDDDRTETRTVGGRGQRRGRDPGVDESQLPESWTRNEEHGRNETQIRGVVFERDVFEAHFLEALEAPERLGEKEHINDGGPNDLDVLKETRLHLRVPPGFVRDRLGVESAVLVLDVECRVLVVHDDESEGDGGGGEGEGA